jgi:hypothetical protein
MNVAATRSPARRYRAQRFWHRHREIYVSEFVDLSLPARLVAAVNASHLWMQGELLADQSRSTLRSPYTTTPPRRRCAVLGLFVVIGTAIATIFSAIGVFVPRTNGRSLELLSP